MKNNYEFEINMMLAELDETSEIPEPGFFNKSMKKRERYGITRRTEAKRRLNSERKKARLKKNKEEAAKRKDSTR